MFRGAALKDAIAKGVVKGFGSLVNKRGRKAIKFASSVGSSKAHTILKPPGHFNTGNISGNGKHLRTVGHVSDCTGIALGFGAQREVEFQELVEA